MIGSFKKKIMEDFLQQQSLDDEYSGFQQINGWHPFKEKVPGAFVEYSVRKRSGGKVLYFNFDLAKEMGLISSDHPHYLNAKLRKILLDTFGIMIINEYDQIHGAVFKKKDKKTNQYMCTRYLQLQHPDKKGKTSGDGRSLWNGVFRDKGKTWDITSCGTGATCLSPATAIQKKYFKSGDPVVSYGCGFSDLLDGLSAAIMSEIFYKNDISTERTLVLIEYPKGLSINVRAGKNLLRPSHFFLHLKQNNYERLKSTVNFFINRQVSNGDWDLDLKSDDETRYNFFLKSICSNFAKVSAKFEREYIFCWLDWDGDNILADGGIIDYGSIRQFGLFHHEYRYDDVERMSTTIIEQKNKAKYIVQTCAQLVDFLLTKNKKNLKNFNQHSILKYFDDIYEHSMNEILLQKLGFNNKFITFILKKNSEDFLTLLKAYTYFERAKSEDGPIEVSDGVTVNALFCMRDILRELPNLYFRDFVSIPPEKFMEILKSSYADDESMILTSYRLKKIQEFQISYQHLVLKVAKEFSLPLKKVLGEMSMRSSMINRYERVTGDAVIFLSQKMFKERNSLSSKEFQRVYEEFVSRQVLLPQVRKIVNDPTKLKKKENKILQRMGNILKIYREGI